MLQANWDGSVFVDWPTDMGNCLRLTIYDAPDFKTKNVGPFVITSGDLAAAGRCLVDIRDNNGRHMNDQVRSLKLEKVC